MMPFQVVHRKLGTSRQVVRQGVCIWGHAWNACPIKLPAASPVRYDDEDDRSIHTLHAQDAVLHPRCGNTVEESFSWNGIAAAPPSSQGKCCAQGAFCIEDKATATNRIRAAQRCCVCSMMQLCRTSTKVRRAYHYERCVMMYVYISFAEP